MQRVETRRVEPHQLERLQARGAHARAAGAACGAAGGAPECGVDGAVDSVQAMMAEMAQLNAEMDRELASLKNKVDTARAERIELQAGHEALKQQVEEASAVVRQEEQHRLK